MKVRHVIALGCFAAAAAMYLIAQTAHAAGFFLLGGFVELIGWVQTFPHDGHDDADPPRPPG